GELELKTLVSVAVALPPRAEQGQIVEEVDRRLSIVDEIETQIEADLKRAARLRQSILKQAFEGRLVPQDPRRGGQQAAGAKPAAVLVDEERQAQRGPGGAGIEHRLDRGAAEGIAGRVRRAEVGVPERKAVAQEVLDRPAGVGAGAPADLRHRLERAQVRVG